MINTKKRETNKNKRTLKMKILEDTRRSKTSFSSSLYFESAQCRANLHAALRVLLLCLAFVAVVDE